jgi:hypothetical protein
MSRRTSTIFCVQVEQFHTVVKGLNRGPKNTMASIRNHYLLLCASNFTRLMAPIDWVVEARASTAASFLGRARSADKRDLFVAPKGKGKTKTLTAGDLLQLQEVWGRAVPGYGLFRERFAGRQDRLPRTQRLGSIAEWKSTRQDKLSAEEKTWQKMDGSIEVHTRARTHMHARVHAHSDTCVAHTHDVDVDVSQYGVRCTSRCWYNARRTLYVAKYVERTTHVAPYVVRCASRCL